MNEVTGGALAKSPPARIGSRLSRHKSGKGVLEGASVQHLLETLNWLE